MPDRTLKEAASELHGLILGVQELIERDYPDRREVERRFISREAGVRRLVLAVAMILVSSLISYGMAVSTVSACFLGGDDDHPSACKFIPGYEKSIERNKVVLKQFTELQKRSLRNEKRIDQLEKEQGR